MLIPSLQFCSITFFQPGLGWEMTLIPGLNGQRSVLYFILFWSHSPFRFVRSFVCSFGRSVGRSASRWIDRSVDRSVVRSFVCSFIRSFVPSHARATVVSYVHLLYLSLQGPPHELAVIFVDNSGVDIILGMFPFVRELLSRGTKVHVLFKQMVWL